MLWKTIGSKEITIIAELLVKCKIGMHITNRFDPSKNCRPLEHINCDILSRVPTYIYSL
jgi:hypothetical protein